MRPRLTALFLFCALVFAGHVHAQVQVGSKKFTEAVLLGEIATQYLRAADSAAEHRSELGGTRVLWSALKRGDIDVYAEYTGTLREEIFAGRELATPEALAAALGEQGIVMSAPLGFANNYALAMPGKRSEALKIQSISDLHAHPDLNLGFSNEFMDRADGWTGLLRRYDLPQSPRGLDHDLAYRAIAAGEIAVTDVYSTDAEIDYYDLKLLNDDRDFFRDYRAVWLIREDLAPVATAALQRLSGAIDDKKMRRMNAEAKIQRVPAPQVAAEFLQQTFDIAPQVAAKSTVTPLLRYTLDHLFLVAVSLGCAIVIAIPLGLLAAITPWLRQPILAVVGVLQTIPSLALLVIMVPLLGIGALPAIVALFAYSLLPIVRNTVTGITGIAPGLRESAEALGLPLMARLRRVYLPLALPSILAGIKIAAVINVGTATLAALIGAGGYGQPILTGIRLDDTGLILLGAVPAALMALAVQGLFDLAERWLVPRSLR